MSTTRRVATRHSPPHVKKTALKTARSVPSAKNAIAPRITVRGASTKTKRSKEEEREDEVFEFEEDEMTTSFLQYCAMCERQIIVPNSSILYCSESCRRRDAASAAPSAIDPYAALSLTSRTTRRNLHYQYNSHMMSMADMAEHLPTSKSLPSFEFAPHAGIKQARIPPILHDGKIDLDPTEWKPADPGFVSSSTGDPTEFQAGPGPAVVNDLNEKVVSSMAESRGSSSLVSSNSGVLGGRKPKLSSRPASSEAFTYLSQFHRSSDSLASSRPRLRTAVSVGIAPRTHRATPSLSFTSTTRSSSDSGSGSSSPKFQRSDDDDGNSSAAGSQGSSFASTPYEPPASIINKGKGPEAGKSPTREKPARGGSLTLPTTITAITVQAGAHDAEESKGEGESECAENDPANAIISRLSYEKKPLNTPTSPTGGATGAGPVSAAKGSLKKLLTGNDETI